MNQIGVVKSACDGKAVINVVRKGACGDHCSMCGACNAETIEIEALSDIRLSSGDKVELSSAGSTVIFGLLCVFILPILLPLLGYVLFAGWISALYGWIAAAVLLALSLGLISYLSVNKTFLEKLQAKVIRKVE